MDTDVICDSVDSSAEDRRIAMPTDEEMNRGIAEWCGFTAHHSWSHVFIDPIKGELFNHCPNFLDETVGLGLLFKYAVPKLLYCSLQFHGMTYVADVSIQFASHIVDSSLSPTRALAMAIWKVIKEG